MPVHLAVMLASAAVLLLVLSHVFAARFLPIADCDETFNFLEPIHFVLFGSGMQTWENCRRYALRSWLFVWLYAGPALFFNYFASSADINGNKGTENLSKFRNADTFFFIRTYSGIVAVLADLFLVHSVYSTFNSRAGLVLLILLSVNYPTTHAAVSVLPTSFAMINFTVALGCWLHTSRGCDTLKCSLHSSGRKRQLAVFGVVFSVTFAALAGWPFAALVALPMALDLLLRYPISSTLSLTVSLILIVPASVFLDSFYYNYCSSKAVDVVYAIAEAARSALVGNGIESSGVTWSMWNLVRYNVLMGNDGRGSELFGVEPWSFFFRNLLLNAQIMFIACLAAPIVLVLNPMPTKVCVNEGGRSVDHVRHGRVGGAGRTKWREFLKPAPLTPVGPSRSQWRALLYISPFFLWFIFWLGIPHKEERFMSPAFPFLALAAAFSITQMFFGSKPLSGALTNGCSGAVLEKNPIAKSSAKCRSSDRNSVRKPSKLVSYRIVSRHLGALQIGCFLLIAFSVLSVMRGLAVYRFYSGPQEVLYDNYALLEELAQRKASNTTLHMDAEGQVRSLSVKGSGSVPYTLCVGREWYRFPSSFFLHPRLVRLAFIRSPLNEASLPLPFTYGNPGASCKCGADGVNDLNKAIPEQYVSAEADCDSVLDSLGLEDVLAPVEYPRDAFKHKISGSTERFLIDVSRTPMLCRILYYPMGISDRCVVWRRVSILGKEPVTGNVNV
uniref:Mannosyltransferase n=1 Tax=Trypanosoma vivax (strain Y486) TaxID=1055687 RepID=G0TWD6_TRYVY|nr:putative Alg9-like mannosyltransferase [Trypanosoma vivax Y486]